MNESQAYVAFNLTENVGAAKVAELKARFGSVSSAWEGFANRISRRGDAVDWQAECELARRYGVSLVTPVDPAYPPMLLNSPGAPLVLYVKGDVGALRKPMLALIGTRRATPYGKSVANRLAYDLAKAGWTIVSGLALGIDGESHRGALDAGGVTVGVLGSGLDRFYPEENRLLAREMVANGGAVISEFPFGRSPDQETFPIRNHVVAALARGVVAIESPAKSGTLITTAIAGDLGRTVMAVPGRVDGKMSAGCLKLIRDGAILVRNADDVLEAMSEFLPREARCPADGASSSSPSAEGRKASAPEMPRYSIEESLVMNHVDEEGIALDELVRRTRLPVEKVNALAMSLRLKGFLKFLPGNRISLLTSRP